MFKKPGEKQTMMMNFQDILTMLMFFLIINVIFSICMEFKKIKIDRNKNLEDKNVNRKII